VRAAATPLFYQRIDVQLRSTCIGHKDKCWEEKTLDEVRKKKMM
jgi:hypothetical protein